MLNDQPTRRRFLGSLAATGIALSAIRPVSADSSTQYIVSAQSSAVQQQLEQKGFEIRDELANGNVILVQGSEGETDEIEQIDGVRAVIPNVQLKFNRSELDPLPNEAFSVDEEPRGPDLYPLQWDKQIQNLLDAHEYSTGEGTTLAILDTGIDPDHRDLAPNVDEGASELLAPEFATPIDDHPWDNHSHGTHVAGIAGAADSKTGIVGTAPDATLVSTKVFWFEETEDGKEELVTTFDTILRAIDYAAEIGADAANMSLGSILPLPPQARSEGAHVAYQFVTQYAARQGTVVVAAAGNHGANLQGGQFVLPTSVPGTLSVSATGPEDELAYYSNYGTNEIDVGAPGGGYETPEKTLTQDPDEVEQPWPYNAVFSAVPEVGLLPDPYIDTTIDGEAYAWVLGTSMAAPQVTGLVGLIRDLAPEMNANQVEQAIKDGADLAIGQNDPELGAGRINALDTVEHIQ